MDDGGASVGVQDVDACMLRAMQSISNGISQDLARFVDIRSEDRGGRPVVLVDVRPGTERPYYLSDKDPRPAGVYVRLGAGSIPASEPAILEMLRDSSRLSFESMAAANQSLAFEEAARAFGEANVAFKLVLPSHNPKARPLGGENGDTPSTGTSERTIPPAAQPTNRQTALALAARPEGVSRSELQTATGLARSGAGKLLAVLLVEGVIEKRGAGPQYAIPPDVIAPRASRHAMAQRPVGSTRHCPPSLPYGSLARSLLARLFLSQMPKMGVVHEP